MYFENLKARGFLCKNKIKRPKYKKIYNSDNNKSHCLKVFKVLKNVFKNVENFFNTI